ncbi:MAG TPA: hypothetical protein DCX53_15680 [Anaerolineae bacterium]|nr:hypothetical protein [Anaerolineae bacterium]
MNMILSNPFIRRIPPIILALTLTVVYLITTAPGLTWANNGSDGGDLITAAYTGGIAHPTGYPFYLLLARFFQSIPIGTLAYRTNLLSVFASVCSAVLIYGLVMQTLFSSNNKFAPVAGMTAGFAFGLSPMVWSQAVITEVYALQSLLTAAILCIFIHPIPLAQKTLDRLRGLLLGLAMGNHITTIFLIPLTLVFVSRNQRGGNFLTSNSSSLVRQFVWLLMGLSLYLTLPIRALTNPPVNWGNPITMKRFYWLVSGELYQSYYLQFQPGETWERIQAWASLLLQQFGLPGVALGVAGLILLFKPSRLYLSLIWTSLIFTFFALGYSSDDSYVYLIPLYISFSIWIGLAVGDAMNRLTHRSNLIQVAIGFLCVGYFLFRATGYANQVDASKDMQAEMFGRQVMSGVQPDALVFVKGDKAVFTLWYFHFALNQRPDIIVIAEDLLHFDWYRETLRNTYSSLELSDQYPWVQSIANANPARTTCHVRYTDRAEIKCG